MHTLVTLASLLGEYKFVHVAHARPLANSTAHIHEMNYVCDRPKNVRDIFSARNV